MFSALPAMVLCFILFPNFGNPTANQTFEKLGLSPGHCKWYHLGLLPIVTLFFSSTT